MAESMVDIGTRRIFNEDHDLMRDAVRKFLANEATPNNDQSAILIIAAKLVVMEVCRYEKDGQVSRELWKKAGDNGLLGECAADDAQRLSNTMPCHDRLLY